MLHEKPICILLVEDNHGDVALFSEAIEIESQSIALHVANSVDEGIGLLTDIGASGIAIQPSIILLDLHLPGKDGKSFLRYLNVHPEFISIPVIMLSSSTRQIDFDDCMRLGAWQYRVKPLDWAGYQDLMVFLRQFWDGTVISATDRTVQDIE